MNLHLVILAGTRKMFRDKGDLYFETPRRKIGRWLSDGDGLSPKSKIIDNNIPIFETVYHFELFEKNCLLKKKEKFWHTQSESYVLSGKGICTRFYSK